MSDGIIALGVVLGPLIFFPVMWVSVSWLISVLSGWKSLARHYAIDEPELAPKPEIKWQSLAMGYTPIFAANYSRVVNIGIDETHMYLSTIWLFRIGHKALRIPFEDIEISDTKFLFFSMKRLAITKAPNMKIYMQPSLVQKIEKLALAGK